MSKKINKDKRRTKRILTIPEKQFVSDYPEVIYQMDRIARENAYYQTQKFLSEEKVLA